jgi:hypothetical protein
LLVNVYILVKYNFLVVSQYLKICNLPQQNFPNFQFTPLKDKSTTFWSEGKMDKFA